MQFNLNINQIMERFNSFIARIKMNNSGSLVSWGKYDKSRVTELDIKKELSEGILDPEETKLKPMYFHDYVDDNSALRLLMDLRYVTENMKDNINDDNPIWIYINSYGGDLLAGFNIMDEIANLSKKYPIYTLIDGKAASAATMISIAGKKRFIKENSFILIHQLSSGMVGKYSEMKEQIANMDMFMSKIKKAYSKYTKISDTALDEILKHDIWWDAEKALEYGFVDAIIT